MANLKNKPKQGQKLHTWIALGGKPKERKNCGPNAVYNKKGKDKY